MSNGARLPLQGVRICDFSWAIAGPATTKHLALFGAEVIKIETRTRLDGARLANPFFEGRPGVNRSAYFANHNLNKLSIRLEMSKPEAKDIVLRLLGVCDVVVESFSSGVLSRMGLDYPALAKIKPDLVMLSLSMQGQTGPYASHLGFGRTLSGLVGIDNLTGFPESNPGGPNQPYTDLVVPWFASTALIAALRRREATGQGQYLDLSQLEASMHFLAPALLDYSANGRDEIRQGNRVAYAAPHGVYPCKSDIQQGRWVAIAAETDGQWADLCRAMGRDDLAQDERFATLLRRKRNEDELDSTIADWTMDMEPQEAAAMLRDAGVPAAEVATGRTLYDDPQLKHRGFFRSMDHPTIGAYQYYATSFRAPNMVPAERRAPQLGEHNGYVLAEVLGMNVDEVEALEEQGILN